MLIGLPFSACVLLLVCEHRFTLLHQEDIEFQNYGLRHNVAQLCVLKVLILISDHLNFNCHVHPRSIMLCLFTYVWGHIDANGSSFFFFFQLLHINCHASSIFTSMTFQICSSLSGSEMDERSSK